MQWNILSTTLYLLLTNEDLLIGNRYESIESVLLELNFAINLNGFNGKRIRMKAEYNDSNGQVRFKTTIHIDSDPGGALGTPKVAVIHEVRRHELAE